MTAFEPIDTESVRNTYVDRHGPDQEAYDEFDDWLRRVKAQAWDEGEEAGYENAKAEDWPTFPQHNNPYRKEQM